jgi:hypothetical protein
MPIMVITREDLLRGRVVTPGWYKMKIKAIEDTAAGTDGSTNTNVSLVIIQPGDFLDVPLKRVFNEKAPGFAVTFIQSITGKRLDSSGGSFDLSNAIGREVYGYIKTGVWQGRPRNEVDDFLPVGKDGSPAKLE